MAWQLRAGGQFFGRRRWLVVVTEEAGRGRVTGERRRRDRDAKKEKEEMKRIRNFFLHLSPFAIYYSPFSPFFPFFLFLILFQFDGSMFPRIVLFHK